LLQLLVRTVTERLVPGLFAAAQVNRFAFLGGKGRWCKYCPLMGTVAEGLAIAVPAGAPVVGFACFDIYDVGGFLCNVGFLTHDTSPVSLALSAGGCDDYLVSRLP